MGSLVRLALVLVFVAAAAFVGFSSWCAWMAPANPQAVLAVAPWRTDAMRARLVELSRTRPAEVTAAARQLLVHAPLSETPFENAGIAARTRKDAPAADRAFALAFRRDPRSIPARLWFIERAAEKRDAAEVVRAADRLTLIDQTRKEQYLDVIAAIALTPDGRKVIEEALKTPRWWSEEVVIRMGKGSSDIASAVRMSASSRPAQGVVIERLMRERGVDAAFLAWLEFLEPERAATLRWPFNASFEQLDIAPPFNWRLLSDQSEIDEAGGLNVTYLGKGKAELADQIMMLGAGSYRFSAAMEGTVKSNGGKLVWSISCYPNGGVIGALTAANLANDKPARQSVDFVVPRRDCGAQRLSLSGAPGEFALWARATTQSVDIAPIAAPPEAAALRLEMSDP